jgi:hypothetical protein
MVRIRTGDRWQVNRVHLLALVPLCLALAFWWVHPGLGWDMDSLGYVQGSPARTATYHLFLLLFYGPLLLPVQLLLFAAALSWLALYSSKFLPWLACAALVFAIAANPYVWELQATVMSEALTTPLLTLIVGCMIGFAVTRRSALLIFAGLLCGVAATARPSLLPIVITPLCALWIDRRSVHRLKVAALILAVWIAPIIAEKAYSRTAYGSGVTSYLGRNMFMKAAIVDAPETWLQAPDALDRTLLGAVNEGYAPVRRLIDDVRDRDVRYILMTNYESCAAWSCGESFVRGFRVSEAELERHLYRVSAARLKSNPAGYLRLSASEYQRMFLLHPRKHPRLALKYNAFLSQEAPLPFQSLLGVEGQPTPPDQQKGMLRFNRLVFAGIGLLAALMTVLLAIWRPNRRTEVAFVLLLGTQAVLIFTALLAVGQPRYAMGMWPTLIAGELLGLYGLVEWGIRRFDARAPGVTEA